MNQDKQMIAKEDIEYTKRTVTRIVNTYQLDDKDYEPLLEIALSALFMAAGNYNQNKVQSFQSYAYPKIREAIITYVKQKLDREYDKLTTNLTVINTKKGCANVLAFPERFLRRHFA